jgi:small subunit ribosomal protein S1
MKGIAIATQQHRLLSFLLPAVQAAGMTLSPDRLIRLQRLWQLLPDECSMNAMRNQLCPIFATDERQQDLFIDTFERIVRDNLELPRAEPVADLPKETNTEITEPEDAVKSVNDSITPQPANPPSNTLQNSQNRRPLVAELDRCTEPPFSWNIAPKENDAEINIGEGFTKTLLHLRRREWADYTAIDVSETIKASVVQGGLPTFRYKRQTRPPEYLLLVERFSRNDHRAGLFDYVFQALRANEVFVERFFYDSDPRINRNEQYTAGLNLHELRNRFPDARLVVLGSGHRLLSPRTGKLAEWTLPLQSWRVRALLTPVPHAEWGYQEGQLGAAFLLLPASVESLQYIAESPDAGDVQYELLPDYLREIAEKEPITLQEPIMRSLRQHFDSGMLCWIAACAVYPALHFELTLQLGKVISTSLGYNLVTAANLLTLSRLSWFTSGRISLPVRTDLMKYLEQRHPERRLLVLAYLSKLMEDNPPSNENSVAYAEHRVNLAVLKVMTGEKPDAETVADLRAVVKRLDREAGWGDFVLPEVWEDIFKDIELETTPVPPEIVAQGDLAIQQYLFELGKQNIQRLFEAQIIVIGEGGAGKTTLVHKLLDKNAPMPRDTISTRGIEKTDYNFLGINGEEYRVSITDFGGQEIYNTTHQFFYKERTLYLLVESSRINNNQVVQWLESVEIYGNGSPVILVHNEVGDLWQENHYFRELQLRFPFLKEEHHVNFMNGRGLDKLTHSIQSNIQKLPQIGSEIPKSWANIRKYLEQMGLERPYISWGDFLKACNYFIGILEAKNAESIANYLHNLGSILYYPNNQILSRVVILQPNWASNAIYEILNNDFIIHNRGRFNLKDLDKAIASKEWKEMKPELIELMKSFGICFQIGKSDSFIVPQLLPPHPSSDYLWKEGDNLQMELHYFFKPTNLLSRFIVRKHNDIAKGQNWVWRKGVVLDWNQTMAEIVEFDDIKIKIRIQGKDCKGFLTLILKAFDELHTEFNGIEVKKLVPCKCSECSKSARPHLFHYEMLLKRIERHIEKVQCDISFEDIAIRSLLADIEVSKSVQNPLKAFISYSKHDIGYVREFRKHIQPLVRNHELSFFDDSQISPEEEWYSSIKMALESADIIFVLISADHIASDYLWDAEMKIAIQRHEIGLTKVIPIILRPCQWRNTVFGQLKSLPLKNEAISNAINKEEAWIKVIQEVHSIVKFKSDSPIAVREFHDKPNFAPGDNVEEFVESRENSQGQFGLSHRKALILRVWESIVDSFKNGTIIRGSVLRKTKGGLIVDCNGLETFLPGSQIDIKPVLNYDQYVGKMMEFKVVQINEELKSAVVSHKSLIENDLAELREQILAGLEKGQLLVGTVKNITDFGAFIDLGGVDGLLYITDISWGRITHPTELIALNQRINVVVLDFDAQKKRISLGYKQLTPHPWELLQSDLSEGSIVTGKIVQIEDNYAFVEIQPGIEGLIHKSEITWNNPKSAVVKKSFKVGQEVKARIISIDRANHKMALSVKQLTNDPWLDIENRFPLGSRHVGTVKNMTNYGIFVEFGIGLSGMVHISDLSWIKRYGHPSEFIKPGALLEVVVLDIDHEKRQISLGHKQIMENPWDAFNSVFTVGSYHEATVLKRDYKGATFQMPQGIEAFAPAKHIRKDDRSLLDAGETVTVKVIEFNIDGRRLLVSHTRYLEDLKYKAEAAVKAEREVK